MAYKKLIKVSNVCQLLKPNFLGNQTKAGVTVTSNGDTFTVNGTATERTTIGTFLNNWTPIIGHKMLVSGCPEGGGADTFRFGAFNQFGVWDYGKGNIGKVITTGTTVGILFESGTTFDNLVFKPQLFDLTEMYGAGNEPTTVAEFKTKYPDDLYPYNRLVSNSYKKLVKVSDMCQLLDKSGNNPTQTICGATFTNNGDGSFTITGTPTAPVTKNIYPVRNIKRLINGHKYLLSGCPENGGVGKYFLRLNVYNPSNVGWSDKGGGTIFTFDQASIEDYGGIYIYIRSELVGKEVNQTYTPQLFDLTEMFGAGHEPTTVEAFKALYPLSYYPYQPYCFAPVKSSNFIGKTKNLFDGSKLSGGNLKKYFGNNTFTVNAYSGSIMSGIVQTFKSLTPGTSYTITYDCIPSHAEGIYGSIRLYNGNTSIKTLIPGGITGHRTGTFSLTQEEIDSFNAIIFFGGNVKVPQECYFCNIQLEEGDTATPFTMPDFV